jgi:O-antigen/teichoic acid export membrane protein
MSAIESARKIAKSTLQFSLGEIAARLCTLALFAFTTRRFGVVVFGYVALAQALANYVALIADQGYKMIGARLAARNHRIVLPLVGLIVPRRMLLAVIAASGGCLYALWGPIPSGARAIAAVFILAVIPATFAVDWVFWGTGSFYLLSGWKALVACTSSAIAIVGMIATGRPLISISLGTVCAAVAGSLSLWISVHRRFPKDAATADEVEAARSELRTSRVLALGISNLLNLVFTNSDLLILAAICDSTEVGNYGAATRLLYVIFSAYYLVCNSLYPRLAKAKDIGRVKRWLFPILASLFGGGALVAFATSHFSSEILGVVYGSSFGAKTLFAVLMLALPFEMVVSLLGTLLASRGYESMLLRCLAVASTFNVALNLILIPRYHALAAAWTTVASYGLLCTLYLWVVLKSDDQTAEAIAIA